jgi:hypothetical protein
VSARLSGSVSLFVSAWLATVPVAAYGQIQLRDLVVTLGGSVEGYSGNFSAVTVPIVDSAEHATAVVGELGVRGDVYLLLSERRSLELSLDGGMRQAAAVGFELRDYAPREWVGSSALLLTQNVGSWGSLRLRMSARTRAISDRPPMPLFLQPGYSIVQGSAGIVTRSFDGVSFDALADMERANYRALLFVPQLDLLDRSSAGVEVGLGWGGTSRVRFYGGVRWTEYSNQGSFDPDDPFRRDRTGRVGLEWTYMGDLVQAQVGADGTLNRSNSNRPEYDALSLRTLLTASLPAEVSVTLYALLTGKSYVHETNFARLVPGEEADNASIAFLQFVRPLAANLDGAIRFGWTRAETDIGSAYYRRFGGSVFFNYRPNGG